ncbi:MAG: NACHT domain-containing protein [Methanosarcina sp.]
MEFSEPVKMLNESLVTVNTFLLQHYGFQFPLWIKEYIIFIFTIATIFIIFISFFSYFKSIFFSLVKSDAYKSEMLQKKIFLKRRNGFVSNFIIEVTRLNKESDWNDSIYTELDTEVEVGKKKLKYPFRSRNIVTWINYFYFFLRYSFNIISSAKIENNLSEAINNSKSRTYIIIGDPGSGKTVSLRHLCLDLAKKCEKSKKEKTIVPIYLNLKHLTILPEEIDPVKIREWIRSELTNGQDRIISKFIDDYFDKMLDEGTFFFLFDSFDEIPAVMDAREEHDIINKYSLAIDRFLHANYLCNGLVSSRPFRSPNKFEGQKITILPFSPKKLKETLVKNMGSEVTLAEQIWPQLIQRDDLLAIVSNPFYLSLLSQYCLETRELPSKQYDLFENFIKKRVKADETKLSHFGFTPEETIVCSEMLAFAVTNTQNLGLDANVEQIHEAIKDLNNCKLNLKEINELISALAYSKLGKISYIKNESEKSFSFVHRRFQEYFCASYLRKEQGLVPFKYISEDNRWREVLILLSEVLPVEDIRNITETAIPTIKEGISSNIDSTEKIKAMETIRFLKDGLRSRVEDIPEDLRVLCTEFIQKQLQKGTLLDKKRAIECLILVDEKYFYSILEYALTEDSNWLRETALKSCRLLNSVPYSIEVAIRKNFFLRYLRLKAYQDYISYSVLFSYPQILKPFKQFLTILLGITIIQLLTFFSAIIYIIVYNNTYIFSFEGFPLFICFFLLFLPIRPYYEIYNSSLIIETLSILPIFFMIASFSSNYSLMILMIISGILMLLVLALVYIYPKNSLAWISYPVTIISKTVQSRKKILSILIENIKRINLRETLIFLLALTSLALGISSTLLFLNLGYSIQRLYTEYNFIIASLILIFASLSGLLILFTIFILIYMTLQKIYYFISDQIKLKKISNLLNNNPITFKDAIPVLNSFKTNGGKVQYVQQMFDWLPRETNSKIVIEEAEKNRGDVRDILSKLAESLENSVDIR